MITDKTLVKQRFSKAHDIYRENAFVQNNLAERMAKLFISFAGDHLHSVLEVGSGVGTFTQSLLERSRIDQFFVNDISDMALLHTEQLLQNQTQHYSLLPGDAETIQLPKNLDAIVSTSCFQWFHDIEAFLSKTSALLNENGLLAFSTFGRENFSEIKNTLGVGLQYPSLDEYTQMLQTDYDILFSEEWSEQLLFQTPIDVLKHIKNTGVNAVAEQKMGKERLNTFQEEYLMRYTSSCGQVHLTYHPIIIIARKK